MSTYGASPITRRTRRSKLEITELKKTIRGVLAEDNPMTVRQLFYRLVGLGAIAKTEQEYKSTVCRLLVQMRSEGQLPFEWIADNTRWMRKPRTYGSYAEAPVRISGGQISGAYVHGDDIACNSLEGTFEDITHDGSGYVTVDIGPPVAAPFNGNWLAANQPFCIFAVNLSCTVRRTNGYLGSYPVGCDTFQYFLGIQRSP